MQLIIFNDDESEVVYHCLAIVTKLNKENEVIKIKKNINSLIELVKSISQYPSIMATDQLCGIERSVDTLMDLMRQSEGIDKIMYTPVKAVLGKGFLLAKISFFNMIKILSKNIPELGDQVRKISEFIANTIYTIMCEEVFLSIVENKQISETVRNRAGFLLANVWEYRLTEGINEFAPILNSMWEARKKLIPIYGTMMGTFELTQISESIEPLWSEFIQNDKNPDGVFESIEEFLFTLTYEEIKDLRNRMKEKGLNLVNREKVESFLEKRMLYDDFDSADSREMYRFFRSRNFNAKFRKKAEMSGPKQTIEEHIMCYLLSSNRWIPH